MMLVTVVVMRMVVVVIMHSKGPRVLDIEQTVWKIFCHK